MKKFLTIIISAVCLLGISACASDNDDIDVFGTIYGLVTDKETGDPINNASVLLVSTGRTTVSGTDGSFRFDKLSEGEIRIQVQKDGYITERKSVKVVAGSEVMADIHMSKAQ